MKSKPFEGIEKPTAEEIQAEILENRTAILTVTAQKALDNCPMRYRLAYSRVLSGKSGRAAAAKLKCYECVGWESIVERVGGCTCHSCPLWHVRPKSAARL